MYHRIAFFLCIHIFLHRFSFCSFFSDFRPSAIVSRYLLDMEWWIRLFSFSDFAQYEYRSFTLLSAFYRLEGSAVLTIYLLSCLQVSICIAFFERLIIMGSETTLCYVQCLFFPKLDLELRIGCIQFCSVLELVCSALGSVRDRL